MASSPRVVALLAAYNEERFIGGCLEHLFRQGVEAYLIDNGSTDRTAEVAARHLGRGLIGVETLPRDSGGYRWRRLLERKEELAATLDADWFMHSDPDELRLPPRAGRTLAESFAEVAAAGYNAVNFFEYTFVPTLEEPDHDHPHFRRTMRHYYPFLPSFPHRLNAWRRQPARVGLAWSGGHRVRFPGLRMWPDSFPMRHYLFLSVPHLIEKYGARAHDRAELRRGWHGWRERLRLGRVRLPAQSMLRACADEEALDPSRPRVTHIVQEWVAGRGAGAPPSMTEASLR